MASAMGLVRVASQGETARAQLAEQAQHDHQAALLAQQKPMLVGLAKQVMDAWQQARDAKNAVLPRMRNARRARMGEYAPDKLAAIRNFGGSEVYNRITANKCRVLEAWIKDVFLGQTEEPWTLAPTPQPEIPDDARLAIEQAVGAELAAMFLQSGTAPNAEQVRQMRAMATDIVEQRVRDDAKDTTARMERLMQDQLAQGGFVDAMGEFISYLAAYPSAVLKGPVIRRRKALKWRNGQPQVESTLVPEFEAVDPFRCYPAPGAVTPQDGFFIEHVTFSYSQLYDMIGVPGYDEQAIRDVLRHAGNGPGWMGIGNTDNAGSDDGVAAQLKEQNFQYDCVNYHGPVKGRDLLAWGMPKDQVDDPDRAYEATVWLIDRWVIKAQLNYNPLGKRPYFKSSLEDLPGQFWGNGLCDVLDDVQGVINAATRALSNNMSMASGPMVGINSDRLAPGEELSRLQPWAMFQFRESEFGNSSLRPIDFFQPQSNAQELLTVIEKFYQLADDFSLMPRYMAGSDRVAGAGRTASGLSMLMDAANKGLKGVVSNIDLNVLRLMLEQLYMHNMLYAEDETVKGDAQVVARGALSLMRLESLQMRRNEFLNATANPLDSQIVGARGRAQVLREVAKGLDMDISKIIPPDEVLAQQEAAPPGPQPASAGGPGGGEQLMNGAPVTDNFSPNAMTPQAG